MPQRPMSNKELAENLNNFITAHNELYSDHIKSQKNISALEKRVDVYFKITVAAVAILTLGIIFI